MADLSRSSTLGEDPLHAYSGLSLFPRTLKSLSNPLPPPLYQSEDLHQTHTLLESMPFEIRTDHQEQARAILDESSAFLKQGTGTSVASQDTNEGDKIPNKRERRPGLNRKRGHFTFKPTTSQPPPNEPSFDPSKYPKPEDFFAAYEKFENAQREWQKQSGTFVPETHQNQPSTRPRRPGLPGRKRGSYKHTYTDSYLTYLKASENENPIPSEHTLERTTVAPVTTADREVDDSTVNTDKGLEKVLTELLACSPDELDGDAGVKLLEERLHIKPFDKQLLSLPKLPEFPDVRRMNLKAPGRTPPNQRTALSNIQNLLKGINKDATRKNSPSSASSPPEDHFSFPDRHCLLAGDRQSREDNLAKDLNVCFRSSVANDADEVITNASRSNVGTTHVACEFNSSVQKSSTGGGSDTHSGIHRSLTSPDRNTDNCVDDSFANITSATLEMNVDVHTEGNEGDALMSESEANRNTGRRENDADINEETDQLDNLAEFASREVARMDPSTVEEDSIPDKQDESSESPNRAPEQYNITDGSFEHTEHIQGQHGKESDNTDTACELQVENAQQEVHNSPIERFYDPQAGQVLIDGVNLKEFQLKWIRSKIGLVSQEPVLFTSSIKDNIAYGKEDATVEEIKAAAELANASKFVDKLPQGLDTMVGEHGTQLSGGQKQRIAVARAILKDPRILLLDEATSALDAESERVVQEALDRIMVNRTTVVVAHRLSTVRNADMIAVIHQGKIVEKGSHTELLKDPEGAYSQLIRLQEEKKTEENPTDEQKMSSIESFKQSSLRKSSLGRSLSKGGSSRGNSSRHSFNMFGFPAGIEGNDADQDQEEAATQTKTKEKKVSIRRIAALNKPEIPVLILGAISAAANGVILPLFGILIASVIKAFFKPPKELKEDTSFWAIIFMVLGIASIIAYPAQTFFFAIAGCKLVQRIRSMCFEKVVHMEVGWFDESEHSSGTIGARLSADAAAIRGLVGDALAQMVQNLSSILAGLIIAFLACWQLAFVVLAMLPLIALNGFLYMKFMKGFSADAKKMYGEASQVANDAVGSIRTVASFCAEDKVMNMYTKKCEGPMKTGIRQGIVSGIGFGFSFFVLFASYATSFYVGARLVDDGKTTFDSVFRVFFALTMAAIAISQSSSLSPDSSKADVAAASIFALIDRESKIDPSVESGRVVDNVKGDIELRHVSFKYPARPDVQIFQDLCLSIRAGKTVALVGESGSGKSTVIALLQRFYDPDSGEITLDGVEIKSLRLKWLRQQTGLVSQEPILFNETIRDNIAYGKGGDASESEIVSAAELSNAHGFISGLQQGYDTMVGERGIQLSGGQKQRVAIARAIVKDPKVLLLDEATSALDAESERVVQDALDRVMVNRTTIVVAHRLSTIKNADVIAVVKNGVIVEKGKHDKLISIKDGVYASLVQLHLSAAS